MLDHWIVFVTNRDELKQIEQEPESLLSMEKALHEVRVAPPTVSQCPSLL
jgi:hypothetical protein